MRVDKAAMIHGIEVREPFLDIDVLKLAFQIPLHLRANKQKAVLKSFACQKLSPEIVKRRKVGFPTARRIFLAPPVLSKISQSILSHAFINFTGFDRHWLQESIAACERNGARFPQVWSLYVLSVWFHRWIEGL